jgi:tetratricopeptide (TPR) repeat protein
MDTPDIHYLRAAEGWLELGNPAEALLELAAISPANQHHSDTLSVRWHIEERLHNFETCIEIAREMVQLNPSDPRGFINLSNALYFAGKTEQAYQHGLEAATRFPGDPAQPYNLACYACQMGLLEEARNWLTRAVSLGDPRVVKQWARNDPDLEPLRQHLSIDDL